jgi:hypothetical protein
LRPAQAKVNKPGMMVHTCNPNHLGGKSRRIVVQSHLGQRARPHLKNKLKAKGLGGVAQMVDHLNSKHKALSSIPSTTKKKE